MAGFTSLFLTSRMGSTRPNVAQGYELSVIAMVVLGGVSTSGGKGRIGGPLLAVFIIGFLNYGLGLVNIQAQSLLIIVGLLLILVGPCAEFQVWVSKTLGSPRGDTGHRGQGTRRNKLLGGGIYAKSFLQRGHDHRDRGRCPAGHVLCRRLCEAGFQGIRHRVQEHGQPVRGQADGRLQGRHRGAGLQGDSPGAGPAHGGGADPDPGTADLAARRRHLHRRKRQGCAAAGAHQGQERGDQGVLPGLGRQPGQPAHPREPGRLGEDRQHPGRGRL